MDKPITPPKKNQQKQQQQHQNGEYHCHMVACCIYHRPTVISYLRNKSYNTKPISSQKLLNNFLEKRRSREWASMRKERKKARQKERWEQAEEQER